MNGQDKTPIKQLNEVEIGNHPEKEPRIVMMILDFGKRMEKMQEKFTEDLEEGHLITILTWDQSQVLPMVTAMV